MLLMYGYLAGLSACSTVSKFGYSNLDTVQALDPITGQSYKPLFHMQRDKGGSGGACPHKIVPAPGQVHATGA